MPVGPAVYSICERIKLALVAHKIGTGRAGCKGATPLIEQLGGRGFKPQLRSLLD